MSLCFQTKDFSLECEAKDVQALLLKFFRHFSKGSMIDWKRMKKKAYHLINLSKLIGTEVYCVRLDNQYIKIGLFTFSSIHCI